MRAVIVAVMVPCVHVSGPFQAGHEGEPDCMARFRSFPDHRPHHDASGILHGRRMRQEVQHLQQSASEQRIVRLPTGAREMQLQRVVRP